MDRLHVRFGRSDKKDAREAVRDLFDQVRQPNMSIFIFFCDSRYDLEALGSEMRTVATCPVFGCTTAGEILFTKGYAEGSIVGVSLASEDLRVQSQFIPSLGDFVSDREETKVDLYDSLTSREKKFSLLLIDGLSMLEERAVAKLYKLSRGVPLIGGSAGDGFRFERTQIYHDGAFHQDAAMVILFETELPFRLFKIQHFKTTEDKLVITEADAATRTVMEINGIPAGEAYAETVGVKVSELTPEVFARHPVMLKIGGEYYVRSIQRLNPDGSLSFYCAIDNGLVLSVGKSMQLLENLREQLDEIGRAIPKVKLTLGYDCILRRCEMMQSGEIEHIRDLLEAWQFIGFSTYGEQFNAIHVNHTLTGVMIGE